MNKNFRISPTLKRGCLVLGASQTKFSISRGQIPSFRDLAAEATEDVLAQAGCARDEIDFLIVSNAVGFANQGQGHMNALVSTHLDLLGRPSVRIETACASGSVGVRLGAMAIEAGWADNVLIVGTEVMSGMDRNTTQKIISGGGDSLMEIPVGATFPGLYACYGMTLIEEQADTIQAGQECLRHIALKNHHNAKHNPKAQYNFAIEDLAEKKGITDVWEFLNNPKRNPPIAWPLHLFDCSPISDGGAAVILSGKDCAESYSGYKNSVELKAIASSTGHLPMGASPTYNSLPAAEEAALAAYQSLDIDPNEPLSRISVAEVHDCFTSAEVLALGDLHFFKRSESLAAAKRGDTAIGGKIPVNTSGGLKAKGHPIAVTGLSQIVYIRNQLIQQMPKPVQVENPDLGLCHNVGGTGGTSVVSIYSLPEVN